MARRIAIGWQHQIMLLVAYAVAALCLAASPLQAQVRVWEVNSLTDLVTGLQNGEDLLEVAQNLTAVPELWPQQPVVIGQGRNVTIFGTQGLGNLTTLHMWTINRIGIQLQAGSSLQFLNIGWTGLNRLGIGSEPNTFMPFLQVAPAANLKLQNVTLFLNPDACDSRPDYTQFTAELRRVWLRASYPDLERSRLVDNSTHLVESARVPVQFFRMSRDVVVAANVTAEAQMASVRYVCQEELNSTQQFAVSSRVWTWPELRMAVNKGDSRSVLVQANLTTNSSPLPLLLQDFRTVEVRPAAEVTRKVVVSLVGCNDIWVVGFSGTLALRYLTLSAPAPACNVTGDPPAWYVAGKPLGFSPFGVLLPDTLNMAVMELPGVYAPARMQLQGVTVELEHCNATQFAAATGKIVGALRNSTAEGLGYAYMSGQNSLVCDSCLFEGTTNPAALAATRNATDETSSRATTVHLVNSTITCKVLGASSLQAASERGKQGGKRHVSVVVAVVATLASCAAAAALLAGIWLWHRRRLSKDSLSETGTARTPLTPMHERQEGLVVANPLAVVAPLGDRPPINGRPKEASKVEDLFLI